MYPLWMIAAGHQSSHGVAREVQQVKQVKAAGKVVAVVVEVLV